MLASVALELKPVLVLLSSASLLLSWVRCALRAGLLLLRASVREYQVVHLSLLASSLLRRLTPSVLLDAFKRLKHLLEFGPSSMRKGTPVVLSCVESRLVLSSRLHLPRVLLLAV